MTDDYDVTTPEHLAWVKGLRVGDEVEWHGLNRWEHVVMGGPAHPLVAEFIRPTAAERQRMARLDAMGYPPPPNAVIAVAKLQTALDALQIAHDEWKAKFDSERHHAISLSNANRDLMSQRDEWRDRALRAEAKVQRMELPDVPEHPEHTVSRGLLTMAAVSKGVGR